MRKNIIVSALALIGAVAFTSCVRENLEPSGESQKGNGVNITVNTGSVDLKSYIEYDEAAGKYLPKWHKGDALGAYFVNASGANPASLANANEDGTKASFTGTASLTAGDYTLYAVYPARAVQSVSANLVAELEFPYIQFPSATSFDPKADILVNVPHSVSVEDAQTDVIVNNMCFRRAGSIVKVVLSDKTGTLAGDRIKSVYLESDMAGAALSGVLKYDYKTEDAAGMSSSKNHVTADLTRLETLPALDGQSAVYLVLPPCTLTAGSKLTVNVKTDKHEVVKNITLPEDIKCPSSEVVTLNVSLDASCTIERVYFQDNFDWLYYWVLDYREKNPTDTKSMDPVGDNLASHSQPNIWSKFSNTIGADFTARSYIDLCPSNKTLYLQENYFKMGASNKQTGLKLPEVEFGNEAVDVILTFDWCAHMAGDGAIDIVPLVVSIEGDGTCDDTGTKISNRFVSPQNKSELRWIPASIRLNGVTSATRISIYPKYESFTQSSVHRWHIDNIKIKEAGVKHQTVATFPVVWSMKDPAELVEGVDYLAGKSYDGSYVYSDDHKGKLTVIRESGPDPSGASTYGWRTDNNNDDPDYVGGALLHYNVTLDNYWLFDVYNVKNPAGMYNISYFMSASNAGPKCFVLEYSVDNGENWVEINVDEEKTWSFDLKDDDSSVTTHYDRTVRYTYALAPESNKANEVCAVNESFHLDAIETMTNLKIRARVISDVGHQGNRLIGNGTNRIFKNITISFTPDAQ